MVSHFSSPLQCSFCVFRELSLVTLSIVRSSHFAGWASGVTGCVIDFGHRRWYTVRTETSQNQGLEEKIWNSVQKSNIFEIMRG